MRKLPSTYSEVKRLLPTKVVLNSPTKAFITNPNTGKEKVVTLAKDTAFTVSEIPNLSVENEENAIVQTDIVASKVLVNGKPERVYAKLKYNDLVDNGLMIDLVGGKYKLAKKSLLIFGIPRTYFFSAVGVAMIVAGVYFFKKR
jgi:hypothetical protein